MNTLVERGSTLSCISAVKSRKGGARGNMSVHDVVSWVQGLCMFVLFFTTTPDEAGNERESVPKLESDRIVQQLEIALTGYMI